MDRTKKFNILAVELTAAGILFGGLIRIDKLVSVMYPLAGYSGILFVVLMIRKELRKNINNKKITVNAHET
ncbi:MAG: hypothetical protein QMB62_13260 [Oscillospiraceae bacterium]